MTALAMQLLSLAAVFVALVSCTGSLRSIRFIAKVPSRGTECFYEQTSREDTRIDVGVQVLRGGDLNIGLSINKSEKEHVLSAQVTRDSDPITLTLSGEALVYKICLENTFSLLAEKMVHFMVIVYENDHYVGSTGSSSAFLDLVDTTDSDRAPAEHSQDLEDLEDRLIRLKWQLFNFTSSQNYFRGRRARDNKAADADNRKVLMWSILQVVVMVFSSLVQIIAIRGIVTNNVNVHNIGRT